MKFFTAALAALLLAGCSSLGHEVASGVNNSQLRNTLGEPYSQVMYERPDFGVITDWATEFYKAGSSTCWVGICGGAKKEQVPVEELDRIVKTSSGQSIQAWRQ